MHLFIPLCHKQSLNSRRMAFIHWSFVYISPTKTWHVYIINLNLKLVRKPGWFYTIGPLYGRKQHSSAHLQQHISIATTFRVEWKHTHARANTHTREHTRNMSVIPGSHVLSTVNLGIGQDYSGAREHSWGTVNSLSSDEVYLLVFRGPHNERTAQRQIINR